MPHTEIQSLYEALNRRLKTAGARDLKGTETAQKLVDLVLGCRVFLATLSRQSLVSKVAGKGYFMFRDARLKKFSRSINVGLYLDDLDEAHLRAALSCQVGTMTPDYLTKVVYTAAASYCCTADILKESDQKTPGTFFEVLIGHIVAEALGVNPEQQIRVPTLDINVTIPTDYVFDLGPVKNRVHLPIKLSTRERVVQVWAHQRVLDGMHGVARFKGVLVAMAETNKQKNVSVIEVCLPNQWTAYQMYIAQMFRVYYLDIPQPYLKLKERYPFIQVKPFGEFYGEVAKIERSGVGE
jgi:hypothetical protein